MKVGDTFRVFEVQIDNYSSGLVGKQSIEVNNQYYKNYHGVDLFLDIGIGEYPHYGIDDRNQAKQVGTIRIKSLKS